jgi:peptide/nickel transport system permease protein
MIPTLFGVALLVFFLLRVAPGDIVELKYAGSGTFAPKESLDRERKQLGLDKPLVQQFVTWIAGAARFDFGNSMWTGQPITKEIGIRLELSLQLAVMATLVAMALAIPLGTLAALKQDSWIDYAVRIFSIGGLAVPSFWLGIVIILIFLIFFQWMPPLTFTSFWTDPRANLAQLLWPALAVGYRYSAMATRMTRSAVLEVLREDYVRTARAKGLWESAVVVKHALRNALLPIVTVVGLQLGLVLTGAVLTETVFSWPGLGRLIYEAILARDTPIVIGAFVLMTFTVAIAALLTDLVYAALDPRVTLG